MRPLTWYVLLSIIALAITTGNARAEYYLSCYQPIPNIVTIDCKKHHCRWHTQHANDYHRDTRHHRNHHIEKYCNQDMSTGDDNACYYPEMEIN